MDLEPGVTKQGVRDLNSLGPKKTKKKPATGEALPGAAGVETAQAAEQPVAEAPAIALLPNS